MKINRFFRTPLLIVLVFKILNIETLNAQESQKSLDDLVYMPIKQFNIWLISKIETTDSLEIVNIAQVVKSRLEKQQGLSSKILTRFIRNSRMGNSSKIAFIDVVEPFITEDNILSIDLLETKSMYLKLKLESHYNDFIETNLRLEKKIEKENIRLLKIQYSNFLDIANSYLYYLKNKEKAIDYYMKIRRLSFILFENPDDRLYFRQLYVSASIGHIKCLEGELKLLDQLSFIPSTFEDIQPTYKLYIESAGGICNKCIQFSDNNIIKYEKNKPNPINLKKQ